MKLVAKCCAVLCRYLAHGTATDYMYDALRVPISMTWEVYGDLSACKPQR